MPKKKLKEFTFYEDTIKKGNSKKITFIELDYVSDEAQEMMGNPFLYSYEKAKMLVSSIEDFGFCYKKKNIYLSSIIRNPSVKQRIRIKVFKKYWRQNKRDFLTHTLNLKKKKKLSEEKMAQVKPIKIRTHWRIIILIAFLMNLFLVVNFFQLQLIKGEWYRGVLDTLSEWFRTNNYIKGLVIGSLMIDAALILDFLIYNVLYFLYKKKGKKFRKKNQKTFKKYQKIFRRTYRDVGYHYKTNIKRGNIEFQPLDMSDLWSQKYDLQNVSESINLVCLETDRLLQYQKIRSKLIRALWFLVIATDVLLLVFSVVHGIIKLNI